MADLVSEIRVNYGKWGRVDMNSDHKVIGYFSLAEGGVLCDEGGACIIAGTEELLASYIKLMNVSNAKEGTTKKTRFGEIIRGLELGGAIRYLYIL